MSLAASPWLVRTRRAAPRLTLLCLPFAGGGASAFRTWAARLPAAVEVCAVQPPGREHRLAEPPLRELPALVDALVEATRQVRQGRYVLFGHSIGALVGFELARALEQRGEPAPARLIVSACAAPHLDGDGRDQVLSQLPDGALLERLRRLGGTPEAILDHAELMALMLPALRADLALREGHVCPREPRLATPITAFGGHDDPGVSRPELEAWRELTRASFALRGFSGGHFFIRTAHDEVLDALAAELAPLLAERDAGAQHAS